MTLLMIEGKILTPQEERKIHSLMSLNRTIIGLKAPSTLMQMTFNHRLNRTIIGLKEIVTGSIRSKIHMFESYYYRIER